MSKATKNEAMKEVFKLIFDMSGQHKQADLAQAMELGTNAFESTIKMAGESVGVYRAYSQLMRGVLDLVDKHADKVHGKAVPGKGGEI